MSDNGFLDTLSSDYEESESRMVLHIETLTGTAFEIMVSPMDSVLSIKNKIQHDEGIPINQQHLLLGERELNNSSYLEEEGITKECTLKLVLGMRGGPISTRRASSRSEHLIWREIRDFVETTRDDMMAKVPPGSKITLLVYREGDTINLLKVVENNDGSYSTLTDFRKPLSARTRGGNARIDSEQQNDRMRENRTTITKMTELRRKMEELSVKKKNRLRTKKLSSPSTSNDVPIERTESVTTKQTAENSSPQFVNVKPKTDKNFKIKKYCTLDIDKGKVITGKSKVKQWLNSDFYDDTTTTATVTAQKKSKPYTMTHNDRDIKRNFYVNRTYELQSRANFSDSSDDEESSFRNRKYSDMKSQSSIKRLGPSRNYKDFVEPSTSSGSMMDNGDHSHKDDANTTYLTSANSDYSFNNKTSNVLAEYYPEVKHTDFRQSLAHRKTKLEEPKITSSENVSVTERNCTTVHETSSIAILEEETEPNVGNDEPDFNPTATGPISVPSPDANTFTISQIPRERVTTSTGPGSSRNRIRVARFVLKDDQRPKTSPDKISRQFCEFILNDNTKCCEIVNNNESPHLLQENKLRFKRTKYISASHSQLDKITKNSKLIDSSDSSSSSVYSWPRISSSKSTSRVSLTCEQHFSNKLKITKSENNLDYEQRKIHATHDTQKRLYDERALNKTTLRRLKVIDETRKESTVEPLPPIEPPKKSTVTRVRCKKCNKKLNIATIHTCRCGDHFCSQHRYSEVHGCKYDYKTEGRKLIEQANPLVLATKLPKI